MQTLLQFWQGFRRLPSAWLLLVQLALLVLAMLTYDDSAYHAISWSLGVLALLIIAKVIRQSPIFTFWGLFFVGGAFVFSVLIIFGFHHPAVQISAYSFEALAYFYAAYGLLRYMFADRYLTKDELFAAGAVFTLIAWGFAFLYSICQILLPHSFQNSNQPQALQAWLDLLFLSFSLQSATGLSDLIPISPAARVLTMLQMFGGVMYFAVIVSRLVALQYIVHLPQSPKEK